MGEGVTADGQAARPTSYNASRNSGIRVSSGRMREGAAADGQAARPTSYNASRNNSSINGCGNSGGRDAGVPGQSLESNPNDALLDRRKPRGRGEQKCAARRHHVTLRGIGVVVDTAVKE